MMLFLSKILPTFAYPLGVALLLALISLLMRRSVARLLVGLAIVILWVASMPVSANWLMAQLERAYPPIPIDQLPVADVAIILGGILGQPLPPRTEPDLGDPVDRIIKGWRLYRAGKVKTIIVSGGNLPWGSAVTAEAELIRDFLVELGVPAGAIVIETGSRNTRENALNTAGLLRDRGWDSAILVTSGAHMPRALAAFRRASVVVTPAATDIQARYPLADSFLDFLPNAEALATTTAGIKEWLGLAYYRERGWT
jgi:uncharacterized SAM-binding protein YcdF (DUF218 family)